MDKKEYKKQLLNNTHLKEMIEVDKYRISYSVIYGHSIDTLGQLACFAGLKSVLQDKHNMVYLLKKIAKTKIAYFTTLKSLQKIFKNTFTINYTNLNSDYILVEIHSINEDIDKNLEEIGFIIIGVLLRSIDFEYIRKLEKLPTTSKRTNIVTIVKDLYTFNKEGWSSHAIYSGLSRHPEVTNEYFKNIISIFGKPNKKLNKKTTINAMQHYRKNHQIRESIGYDYAYKAILNILYPGVY